MNEHYLLNVGANHILNVMHNTLRLPICSYAKISMSISYIITKIKFTLNSLKTVYKKDMSIDCIPTATFVSPGRSMSVKLTTAGVTKGHP